MRLKCLSCEALTRLVYLCAAHSPHTVDVQLLKLGLHNTPGKLRTQLQAEIDATPADEYDAILLAYGLCGQATLGLRAANMPLIIPRAHDCITLFLGDRTRYKDQFENNPGTYWYVTDYVERHGGTGVALGSFGDETDLSSVYDEYVEKYGADNADYLMEVMGAWQEHYQRAAYIEMGVGDSQVVEEFTLQQSEQRGWEYERLEGNLILIRQLLNGEWGEDFLVVEPGRQIVMTYDDEVVGAAL